MASIADLRAARARMVASKAKEVAVTREGAYLVSLNEAVQEAVNAPRSGRRAVAARSGTCAVDRCQARKRRDRGTGIGCASVH